jgi:hypothetical protein
MPSAFGKRGRNKRTRFSIHFYDNSEEFNQLFQIDYLNLVGYPAFQQPQPPGIPPLQSHPSIAEIPKKPHMKPHVPPTNYGSRNVPANPPFGVVNYPTMSLPLLPPPPLHPTQPIVFFFLTCTLCSTSKKLQSISH